MHSAQPDVGLLNVHGALSNHPAAMEQLMGLLTTVYLENSLPTARQRELPYLTSAVAHTASIEPRPTWYSVEHRG